MHKILLTFRKSNLLSIRTCKKCNVLFKNYHEIANPNSTPLPSKKIRHLFLDYFIHVKNHTFIPSSSVFLNNDPSLLFVNAGMNQFRSLLMGKISSNHPFSRLRRAANSQKCIRLSGKHNDLDDVGKDLHHHTFFEMLGNWSFGDYSKREACEMAWELLTKVYQLNPDNLYITYFGGCEMLGIPADEECKSIWLDIGIHAEHIFPFVKENFWEMADFGPCGPCTEIHYDFLSAGANSAAKRINADKPDLIELWNLVFIQYNREKNGCLVPIPLLNVDTGMGFERLTAVLQGTMSNYDTDIFVPLFKTIEKNFNVRPYAGNIGSYDVDGIDTAYRILADHSRMFSVSIADGLFPDSYDAGHILRKIIRRASYAANKVMKTRPGVLSSLVPVVAETLDFFPEINKNIKEIVDIVNEEEKLYHSVINRGRKARNKMMTEAESKTLSGQQVYQLKENYGLEEIVINDLASEVNVSVDWEDYLKVCDIKKTHKSDHFLAKDSELSVLTEKLQDKGIKETCDDFKYNYFTNPNSYGVQTITSTVIGVANNGNFVGKATSGTECFIITDSTNFYSDAGGQIADIGKIYNDDFTFVVNAVHSSEGYVFHKGTVTKGTLYDGCSVNMSVDKDHRLACSQNHTATHLVNSALRKILPYTNQRSSYVGPLNLRLGFSSKFSLTLEQMEDIEKSINEVIKKKMEVKRIIMPFEELIDNPSAVILRGEEYPETVNVISIGNTEILSLEPCCGTHVYNTADIQQFVIIPSKSHGGSTRVLSAATGKQAGIIYKNGEEFSNKVHELMKKTEEINVIEEEDISSLLKTVKLMTKECQTIQNAPLIVLKKCEKLLLDQKLKLNDMLSSLKSDENMEMDSANIDKRVFKVSEGLIELLSSNNIPPTKDDYKYIYSERGLKPVKAKVLAVLRDDKIVNSVQQGLHCWMILDKTNFYAEDDDQASDTGIIQCEDFVLNVISVHKKNGYVFHDGYIEKGCAKSNKVVETVVNQDHRLACSQNHTALHLLNAVLKEELPYSYQLLAHAGPKELLLVYSSKKALSDSQLQNIEAKMNNHIKNNLKVLKTAVPVESSNQLPAYKLSVIKKCKELVPTICINDGENLKSVEPCCGTHVSTTASIELFIITSSKSKSGTEKTIRAVTGNQAKIVQKDGEMYEKAMLQLENYVLACLNKEHLDCLELWDCLKDIKTAKAQHEADIPVLIFRKHQNILLDLSKRLTVATNDFVQQGFKKVALELQQVLLEFSNKPYIIYNLESVGDGKKIINYAIDNSQSKPVMYFAKDGHKSIICSCYVPKHLVNSSFSALLWINPVASFLGGKARTLTKDPELLYSVICPTPSSLDKATDIAKHFIESNLIVDSL